MPVSHIGLTVSHIPSATSFYLAALQPLGYRFIGCQGDSIGLGIESADLFLTQSSRDTRPSPNHIAFLAKDRAAVRECYAAALNAGGRPSGAPQYRNEKCTCFNAAVEDLDGNTIEFIYRQEHDEAGCEGEATPSEQSSRVESWREEVAEGDIEEDARSVASMKSHGSKMSKAKSTMQTAVDLASATSKSLKSEEPSLGLTRANTAPVKSDAGGKSLLGAALGAAAGVALLYAMHQTERKNARDEADFRASMKSRSGSKPRYVPSRSMTLPPGPPPTVIRAQTAVPSSVPRETTTPSAPQETTVPSAPQETTPPSAPQETTVTSTPQDATSARLVQPEKNRHRNFSTTESAYSTRRPPDRSTQAQRMIQATGYNDQDAALQELFDRNNHHRPMPTRSKTEHVYDYVPASSADRKTPDRRDEASTAESTAARPRRSHARHDSVVNMQSSSQARRASAYDTLPARPESVIDTATYHPAAISLPGSSTFSRTSSRYDAKQNPATTSTAKIKSTSRAQPPPIPLQASEQSWENFRAETTDDDDYHRSYKDKSTRNDRYGAGEESDGLGDAKTVVPDDSISCVDLSQHRRRRRRKEGGSASGRSKTGSERSESTVRPVKRREDRKERESSGLRKVFGIV
ncbi:unnamed protein product [Zymoseptoria tritici ST99CH_1A5]|uniref:VOC domain-containing protein n=1 Tax=Zymoseptoria tritici ST99CH_1A5 TaxID=1276529 RepID=A0A1Y6LZ78_ZYMTR|nr:unnamed protein product [Zymoseptoria tritici ST99CH_1A5]